jgi:hypothetical protein
MDSIQIIVAIWGRGKRGGGAEEAEEKEEAELTGVGF